MMVQAISEDFLHYVWKFKCFETDGLLTTSKQELTILHLGTHNFNAGPDFSNAKLIIDNTTWVGNVEIHINSSDWIKHKHSSDPAYESIVLHVVHTHDREIPFLLDRNIQTLELKNLIDQETFKRFLQLSSSKQPILCADEIQKVPSLAILNTIEKLGVERLENKTSEINRLFQFTNQNWEESLYILLAKYYGTKINADPFERLARSIPLILVNKLKNEPIKIEALFFGQSGLLPTESEDTYVHSLIVEYDFLRQKHLLKPLSPGVWKFARMRPIVFPTIRIALFTNLLCANDHLFSKILKNPRAQDLKEIFQGETHSFWDTHYHFRNESVYKVKRLGAQSIDSLFINVISPLLFFYAMKTDNRKLKTQAIKILESLKAEKNSITQSWHEIGVIAMNAFDSQAQIELKKSYCDLKRCVECNIGHQILSKD